MLKGEYPKIPEEVEKKAGKICGEEGGEGEEGGGGEGGEGGGGGKDWEGE